VLPFIVILVIITTAVAAVWLAPLLVPRRVVFDEQPDRPRPFGSDMSWLAVRSDNAAAVAAALGLDELRPANWNSGLGAIYDHELADGFVFVSPPVKGWTLVAGVSLPLPASGSFIDKLTPLLQQLSRQFSAVQYFAAFPIIDFYAWARFEKGRRVRAFAIGEAGIVADGGKLSVEERRLGLSLIELRGIRARHGDIGGAIHLHPTEQHVLSLAKAWSINPMAIESFAADAGVGWVARAPRGWRAERLRRVA
jgi:hypothetical protein